MPPIVTDNVDHTMRTLSSFTQILAYLSIWLLSLWIALLMHELGHALAVRLSRGGLTALGASPLRLLWRVCRVRLEVQWRGWSSLERVQGLQRPMPIDRQNQLLIYLTGLSMTLVCILVPLTVQDAVGTSLLRRAETTMLDAA